MQIEPTYTVFAGHWQIAAGPLPDVLLRTKQRLESDELDSVLVFDDRSGGQVDFDLRGSPDDVVKRLAQHPLFRGEAAGESRRAGPGRPRLGVVGREVTLLPRHWEWLERQPRGISATLRRLVDEARKREPATDVARQAREAAGKFMWAMAGNFAGFEEASRALFRGEWNHYDELVREWPRDIRAYLGRLLASARTSAGAE